MAPTLKDKLWNDGEEFAYEDFNDMQRFNRSILNDAILGSLCWSGTSWEHGTFPDASTVYALRGGGMPYYVGALGVSMTLNPGLIGIAQAADWWSAGTGDDANFRIAYLTTTPLTFTANSSGNPRYDLIQVTITQADGNDATRHFEDAVTGVVTSQGGGVGSPANVYRKRYFAATVSVKTGTPAGSPTVPTADAGYVALAAVLLNDGYAGGTARPNGLLDYRVPLGSTVERVMGNSWTRTGTWANSAFGIIAPASVQSAWAVPSTGSHHKRLMKVGLARQKLASSTGAVLLVRMGNNGSGATLLTLTSSLMSAGGHAYEEYSLLPTAPVWASGHTGRDISTGSLLTTADSTDNTVALEFDSDGTRQDFVHWARFFFAGGL